jgi:glycosyltransferase involved in cell wall biosynthesis
MLYICIPAHNEGATIGLLIWRIRKVFQGYSREYEILVYDDASTDDTAEVLAPYADVAPLAVIRGEKRVGYGRALDILAREASRRTKYPRRDGMIIMQGDFTDQPENLPELIKRFEGGADVVIGERPSVQQPLEVKRMRQLSPWAIRFFIGVDGIADPFSSFRLIRISIIRDLLKTDQEKPLVTGDGWGANVSLLLTTLPLARRVEKVEVAPRYDLRVRTSRIRPFSDAMALYRFGKTNRGKRLAVPTQPQPVKERATS